MDFYLGISNQKFLLRKVILELHSIILEKVSS